MAEQLNIVPCVQEVWSSNTRPAKSYMAGCKRFATASTAANRNL